MTNLKEEYIDIIKQYLDGFLSIDEYVRLYQEKHLSETREYDPEVFELLDWLFVELEGYTENQQLLNDDPDFYKNKIQVYDSSKKALQKLQDQKSL